MNDKVELRPDSHPEYWRARGIGHGGGMHSLVTGQLLSSCPDISGFVQCKEAGERIVKNVFGGRARLDFRDYEPNWVQVKIGVEVEFKDVLTRIMKANQFMNGIVDDKIIKWAIDPKVSPGYEPYGLRAYHELEGKKLLEGVKV